MGILNCSRDQLAGISKLHFEHFLNNYFFKQDPFQRHLSAIIMIQPGQCYSYFHLRTKTKIKRRNRDVLKEKKKAKIKKSKLLLLCLLGLILLPRRRVLVSVNCNTSELVLNLPHLPLVGNLSTESSRCEGRGEQQCDLCYYEQIVSFLPPQVLATKTFLVLGQ